MAPGDLVLVGGGGHARVVADAARLAGWRVLGCVAREAPGWTAHLGGDHELAAVLSGGTRAILAIGAIPVRRRLAELHPGTAWATVVHPAAAVSAGAELAEGVYVGAQAVVGPGAVVGRHAIINSAAVVEHDAWIGELAHVAPAAAMGGRARIGAGAFVGLGARIRDGIEVGADATVGMGAVVVAGVRAGATVLGVPAREVS